MKESITIRNFGPIDEVILEDIKPFTVIIGESASGKSTVLKVIALFRYMFKMLNIRSYLKLSNISKSPFRFKFESYVKTSGLDEMVTGKTEIIYSVFINQNTYTITYKNNKLGGTNLVIAKNDLIYSKIVFMSEMRSVISAWAERGARLAGGYLGFYFHETYNDFDEATQKVKDLNLDYLNLNFQVRKAGNQKEFFVAPVNHEYEPVKLKNASSGIQTSAPVCVITKYFSNDFNFADGIQRSILGYLMSSNRIEEFKPQISLSGFTNKVYLHLEEPELSLFPDAQCELLNFLVRKCMMDKANDRQVGMMIATHSPYIINQLNVLIKAGSVGKKISGASLKSDQVNAYRMYNGKLQDLLSINSKTGDTIINTLDLSEPMHQIYTTYKQLDETF
jgi:predicted ATPase